MSSVFTLHCIRCFCRCSCRFRSCIWFIRYIFIDTFLSIYLYWYFYIDIFLSNTKRWNLFSIYANFENHFHKLFIIPSSVFQKPFIHSPNFSTQSLNRTKQSLDPVNSFPKTYLPARLPSLHILYIYNLICPPPAHTPFPLPQTPQTPNIQHAKTVTKQ